MRRWRDVIERVKFNCDIEAEKKWDHNFYWKIVAMRVF